MKQIQETSSSLLFSDSTDLVAFVPVLEKMPPTIEQDNFGLVEQDNYGDQYCPLLRADVCNDAPPRKLIRLNDKENTDPGLLIENERSESDEIVPNIYCNEAAKWWEESVIYQIYPRSFMDSNNDGVGDLKGITSKLRYISGLGVDVIWLSPINSSPMKDFGYDIKDYRSIDPIFGHMEEFEELLAQCHKLDMKLIMDFVPNHTSDMHEWFIQSSSSRDNPFTNYYVWRDAKYDEDGVRYPPNNWRSVLGGSAWTWCEKREQFYYHSFLPEQPDLNYCNALVREEMKDVLRFWLNKGVDGFRVDAVLFLVEADLLDDEPIRKDNNVFPEDDYYYLEHIHTTNQPGTFDVIREWDDLIAEYNTKSSRKRYLIYEVFDEADDFRAIQYHFNHGSPFNFHLISFNRDNLSQDLHHRINRWINAIPEGRKTFWVLENHDQRRVTSRASEECAKVLNMLLLMLPGSAITYQGQELGAKDVNMPWEDVRDPFGINYGPERYTKYYRDPSRAPMMWNKERHAGFTEAAKPWLPVQQDYELACVEMQEQLPKSPLKAYKQATQLRRQNKAIRKGSFQSILSTTDYIIFQRSIANKENILVICNFSDKELIIDLSGVESVGNSCYETLYSTHCTEKEGEIFKSECIQVCQYEGLILQLQA